MARSLMVMVALVALAGCGGGDEGAGSTRTFSDEAAFEAYVAGYVGAEAVECVPVGETDATCEAPDGTAYRVACGRVTDEGGEDCVISRDP